MLVEACGGGAEVAVLAGLDEIFDRGLRPVLAIEVHTIFAAEAPRATADFCRRNDLRAYRIGDALNDDREESSKHPNAALISAEELAAIRDDYFYVVLLDEPLPATAPSAVLAIQVARPATRQG